MALPKRILVIEDDPVGAKALRDLLRAHGYEVHWARDGMDGVELARIVDPDLVICDILLPRKSGFEICFDLKRPGGISPSCPIIMTSAVLQGTEEQRYAQEDLRADAYFVKPFSMSAMLSRVEQLLSK